MKRLIVATALLLATAQTGQASLETDCYFGGGYFDATYFDDNYFQETNCDTPPAAVSGSNELRNTFKFPGIW